MEKIKLRRREVLALHNKGIEGAHNNGVRGAHQFTYALGRTRRAIEDEVETIGETLRDFGDRFRQALKEHAELGEDGEPATDTNAQITIRKDRLAEWGDWQKNFERERKEFLAGEVEVEVYRVLGEVPDMPTAVGDALQPILPEPKAG